MFVSINWIKEYVDLSGLDIKKLINSFTLATAEVEDIIVKGKDLRDVVVGEILSVENQRLPTVVGCREGLPEGGYDIFESEFLLHLAEDSFIACCIGLAAFHIRIRFESKAEFGILFVAYADVNILHQRAHNADCLLGGPEFLAEIEVHGNCHSVPLCGLAGEPCQFCCPVGNGRGDA